jgi:hypothetical protein
MSELELPGWHRKNEPGLPFSAAARRSTSQLFFFAQNKKRGGSIRPGDSRRPGHSVQKNGISLVG